MKRIVAASFRPHLTTPDFLQWLKDRMSRGEEQQAIGRSLGVTGSAVNRWLSGRSGVSDTVLLLAELRRQAPIDLSAGLPVGSKPAGG